MLADLQASSHTIRLNMFFASTRPNRACWTIWMESFYSYSTHMGCANCSQSFMQRFAWSTARWRYFYSLLGRTPPPRWKEAELHPNWMPKHC